MRDLLIKCKRLIPNSTVLDIDPVLSTTLLGMKFKSPVGISAGLDKDAQLYNDLTAKIPLGFIELGSVTYRSQFGNKNKIIYKIDEFNSVINSLGLPSLGIDCFLDKLKDADNKNDVVLGCNFAKNNDSSSYKDDMVKLTKRVVKEIDYIALNLSCPNVDKIGDPLSENNLSDIMCSVREVNADIPMFVKISPDILDESISGIVKILSQFNKVGLVISNTTSQRPVALDAYKDLPVGGLSGKLLFKLSTALVSKFYKEIKYHGYDIPIIASGGVMSAEDCYEKIKSGASIVQIYSAIIYQGFTIIDEINKDLPILMKRDGFQSISEVVGAKFK